jgi:hypothetical protein
MWTVIVVIALVVMLLALLQVFRMGWRIFRHNEEMVSGGSWGKQLFGGRKGEKGHTT